MSVLIHGMKMPDKPQNCKFYDTDPMGYRKPYCKIQGVCDGLEHCPLVEVPDNKLFLVRDGILYAQQVALPESDYIVLPPLEVAEQDACEGHKYHYTTVDDPTTIKIEKQESPSD